MPDFIELCPHVDASSQHHFTLQTPVTCRSLSTLNRVTHKQSPEARTPHSSPQLHQQEQPPSPKVHQLNLLALLEKPRKSALHIEPVPACLTIGSDERFWIIHQESGLQIPGQFSRHEAEYILEATEGWNWAVDSKTREPAYRWRLLFLLEYICLSQAKLEVAA